MVGRRKSPPLGLESGLRRFESLPRRAVAGHDVLVAVGIRARLLGLALLDLEAAGPGLLIPRCASVHTFGMRFALDIYFLGSGDEILDVRRAVPPRRFVAHREAVSVLEIPAFPARNRGEKRTGPTP
jgi:uncharacterized protein